MISPLMTRSRILLSLAVLMATASVSVAQNGDRKGHVMTPPPEEWNLPAPPLSVDDALRSFQFGEEGFRLEVVAAEPLMVNPVCIAFDGQGRPWVCEMSTYMPDVDANGENEPKGRITILEDTDGDGKADESKVFLDGLLLPRAIQFVEGGILWADNFKLYFTERLKGDKAGETTVVDEEWAPSGNVEHKANGLLYGMDNWLYNAKSDMRYRLIDGEWVKEKVQFRGQWGISQDNFGRIVTNTNSNLLSMEMIPPGYMERNPYHDFSTNVVAKMSNEVHPIRITCGVNRGYMDGTLDDRGFLAKATAACGLTVYRGDNFPAEYQGNVFIPEPAGLLIKRAILEQNGFEIDAEEAYPDKEWLASEDERSRIVNTYTAPDGTLYLVDMYHGILQHRTYVTSYLREQILKRNLDKENNTRGRIYRVVWTGKEPGKMPNMENETSAELVAHLDHPNGWWRDTAQRLIVQRQDTSAADALREEVAKGSEYGQIHALWALEGLGIVEPSDIAAAAKSNDPWVAANAVRVSEVFAGTDAEDEIVDVLASVAESGPAPQVELQLVAALGLFHGASGEKALSTLATILSRQDQDLFNDMAMSGLNGGEAAFAKLAAAQDLDIVNDLVTAVVNRGEPGEVEQVLAVVSSPEVDSKERSKLLGSMASTAMAKRKGPVAEVLLVAAANDETAQNAILDGMVRGGKTKGFKKISLKTRPALLSEDKLPENKKLASVDKLFDFSGKEAVNYIKTEAHKAQFEMGKVEYAKLCIACHQAEGQGMINMAPPLVDSEWVTGPERRLIALTMDGLMGPITVNGKVYDAPEVQPVMPGLRINPELNDEQLAAILTFVRNSWGNRAPPVSTESVADFRNSTELRAPYTEAELKKVR